MVIMNHKNCQHKELVNDLSESIVAVDGNYEVMISQSKYIRQYKRLLERSLKLCMCLTENKVLHPVAHFFENSVLRSVLSSYMGFFTDKHMTFVSKVGVGFNETITQRVEEYKNYPEHLLIGYKDKKVQNLSTKFPDPLALRTSSITTGTEIRLVQDLENVHEFGTLGNTISFIEKNEGVSISLSSIIRWLSNFSNHRKLSGLPLLYDVISRSEGAPGLPQVNRLL